MRKIEDVTHNGRKLIDILADHAKWLAGEGGACANLSGSDLRGLDLRGLDLRGLDLRGSNLSYSDLSGSYLQYSNLSGSDLRGSDLRYSDLSGSYLQYSNLSGSDLRGSDLRDSDLRYSDLRAFGNMLELRTMQIDTWEVGYTADTLQIGFQRHAISKWRGWDTPEGKQWIAEMDSTAPAWAERNLALVLSLIDANPATPTGHETID